MKHFRLNFILLTALMTAMTALSTWLAVTGLYPQAILSGIVVVIAALGLWRSVGKLKLTVWTFARSMEVNDTSISFAERTDDPMLTDTLATFNRCLKRYHAATMDLETRKQYYDRILIVMTHEMGNAITPVIALCDNISKHPERWQGEKLAEAIDLIASRSRGINRFLKAYYNLTHIPDPTLATMDAATFLMRIRRLTEAELQSRGLPEEICRFITADAVNLTLDPDLMSQVMVNLVRNALDGVADTENPQVVVTISVSENRPCITVEDNGTGIDPSLRETLFQPFITTKPEGTGVGLYLSRQIVRRHGGELRVSGPAGKGTTVVVQL